MENVVQRCEIYSEAKRIDKIYMNLIALNLGGDQFLNVAPNLGKPALNPAAPLYTGKKEGNGPMACSDNRDEKEYTYLCQ